MKTIEELRLELSKTNDALKRLEAKKDELVCEIESLSNEFTSKYIGEYIKNVKEYKPNYDGYDWICIDVLHVKYAKLEGFNGHYWGFHGNGFTYSARINNDNGTIELMKFSSIDKTQISATEETIKNFKIITKEEFDTYKNDFADLLKKID